MTTSAQKSRSLIFNSIFNSTKKYNKPPSIRVQFKTLHTVDALKMRIYVTYRQTYKRQNCLKIAKQKHRNRQRPHRFPTDATKTTNENKKRTEQCTKRNWGHRIKGDIVFFISRLQGLYCPLKQSRGWNLLFYFSLFTEYITTRYIFFSSVWKNFLGMSDRTRNLQIQNSCNNHYTGRSSKSS